MSQNIPREDARGKSSDESLRQEPRAAYRACKRLTKKRKRKRKRCPVRRLYYVTPKCLFLLSVDARKSRLSFRGCAKRSSLADHHFNDTRHRLSISQQLISLFYVCICAALCSKIEHSHRRKPRLLRNRGAAYVRSVRRTRAVLVNDRRATEQNRDGVAPSVL